MICSERPDKQRKDGSSESESEFMHGSKFVDSKRIVEGIPKSVNRQHSDIKR